jgi:hypothetical protein
MAFTPALKGGALAKIRGRGRRDREAMTEADARPEFRAAA